MEANTQGLVMMIRRRLQHKIGLSTAAVLLLCLWVSVAQSQTVYRVVDEQGNVTFTDNPERGGDAITADPACPGCAVPLLKGATPMACWAAVPA